MKNTISIAVILLFLGSFSSIFAVSDKEAVEKASLHYIEGFYEGNQEKLKAGLIPKMYKYGFWKGKDSRTYKNAGTMTFEQALAFAKNVKDKKQFPKSDAPKKVEILEVSDKIAITKVTAWWGN